MNNEISHCDYFFMNAAVSDFKISDSSKKIPKNKINDHLNKNFEFVPDILQDYEYVKR